MRKSKHTPGPWRVVRVAAGFTIRAASRAVATLPSLVVRGRRQQAEADAHLIAAAPELLEALQLMVTWEDWIDDPDWLELVKDARGVIAKATGEEGAE